MPKNSAYNRFEDILGTMGRRFDLPRVFDDFLSVTVCAFHQTNLASQLQQKDEANETRYFEVINPYNRDELNGFAEALALLKVSAQRYPYGDLLGRYYTEHITQGHNGQYFTPEGVAGLIAGLSVDRDNPPTGKTIYDPACGSGRLLLEFARVAPNNAFYGNDLSITCAKMTALNMMFNGLVGEAAAMNTITVSWHTGWAINTPHIGIVPIDKEQSRIWTAPQEVPPKEKQLVLF